VAFLVTLQKSTLYDYNYESKRLRLQRLRLQ